MLLITFRLYNLYKAASAMRITTKYYIYIPVYTVYALKVFLIYFLAQRLISWSVQHVHNIS